jgi:ribosomal protein S18 acetylase RimI-like enzyme
VGDAVVLPARATDAVPFATFLVRHLIESGTPGTPDFAPMREASRTDVIRENERKWATPLSAPAWGRTWLLWDREPRAIGMRPAAVVGYVELRGPFAPAAAHRAELSIGMDAPYRGQGWGRKLMETAIVAGREIPYLAYVDLRVFAANPRARALYQKMGFVEVGYVPDAFRFPEGSVDDVLMVLRIR